jgi:hypothetical protein
LGQRERNANSLSVESLSALQSIGITDLTYEEENAKTSEIATHFPVFPDDLFQSEDLSVGEDDDDDEPDLIATLHTMFGYMNGANEQL